ncbi:MAG: hypothetical protein F6K54_23960 [Okeania sp. SIO3B5]|uniref:zinc ribbon domain-containing protein n=1 Tax=Okeania sp. SIO3B5 TaxID=2607811 RepID=UPI0013FE8CD2|nr:hypothetical protein [Okeania sp. SIO3B5]NEO55854.1 hypothetical protein [Okeania sp. SIO3B5]
MITGNKVQISAKKTTKILLKYHMIRKPKQITYKCQLAGIKVIETEESYTSKTSALDLEQPMKHETYRGKRVKRGFQTEWNWYSH